LVSSGKLDNTIIIFTSDNGYLWGEHGLWGKGKPHEESIRVPLVVRMPGVPARRESEKMVAANLDVPRTILDAAGIDSQTDGLSLLELLQDPSVEWRDELLFEHYGDRVGGNGAWAALRNAQWKLVDNPSGTDEFYDLVNDPYELRSLHADPSYAAIRSSMYSRLEPMKGLNITTFSLPKPVVGRSYGAQLTAWGGGPPYQWFVHSGALPAGLTLNSSGIISGTPTRTGTSRVVFRVRGTAIRKYTGARQEYISKEFSLVVTN
jgi:hypothetical protein